MQLDDGVFSVSRTGPSSEPSLVESKDRKANAHLILKLMCDSVLLRPYLRELLSAKYDSTPSSSRGQQLHFHSVVASACQAFSTVSTASGPARGVILTPPILCFVGVKGSGCGPGQGYHIWLVFKIIKLAWVFQRE